MVPKVFKPLTCYCMYYILYCFFFFFLFFLQSLLTDEQVANAPVLILGNKIDKPGAGSEDEIRHLFGLHGQTTGKVKTDCYCLLS